MEEKIREDLKKAQLERDEIKVSTLRLLISEISNARIQKMVDQLSDEEILVVLRKEAKKRQEAANSFRSGGRDESADKEESELKILESYLPAQMSDEQLTKAVQEAITESGASVMTDMGRVIGMVMSKVGQGADGGRVSSIVKEQLTK